MKSILVNLFCLLVWAMEAGGQSPPSIVLVGAGGSFALPIYTEWFDTYQQSHPSLRIRYLAVGSGEGTREVTSGLADFGGSDFPMSDRDLAASKVKVAHFPMLLGAVVPVYNLPGLKKPLNFTGDILAGIFLGTILKWNDSAIAAVNPGVALPDDVIAVVHRMEPSGTTYVWTDFLSKVNPNWRSRVGKGPKVPWRTGVAARGNGGLVEVVRTTVYSIGYCELTYALQNHVSYGLVQNSSGRFIRADSKSIAAAAEGVESRDTGDFRVSVTNASDREAYPISTFTWLLLPTRIEGNKKAMLTQLLRWMLTTGQESELETLGYARLPRTMVKRELEALDKVK